MTSHEVTGTVKVTMSGGHKQDTGCEKVSSGGGGGGSSGREEGGGAGSSAVRITTWNGTSFFFDHCLLSLENCSVGSIRALLMH